MAHPVKVHKDIQSGQMVTCPNMELIDLTKPLEYLISTQGKLVSAAGKYTPDLDLGDFCIDTAFLKSMLTFRAAVICDPCSGKSKNCVESCCSHLQMAKFDHQSGKIKCENPSNGPGNFKSPKIMSPLENLTLVKSDNNRYSNCDENNGSLIVTNHFELDNDGSTVSSGMNTRGSI